MLDLIRGSFPSNPKEFMMSVFQPRFDYGTKALLESEMAVDPISQFRVWFQAAIGAGVPDANAMTLATATPDGNVSARIVLLKEYDARGFTFYTNFESAKGKQLAQNPHAALVFYWYLLERQVRIEGTVEQLSAKEADEYFQTRPIGSQIGAAVSPQSRIVRDREFLEQEYQKLEKLYGSGPVPRPEHWGGYRVVPSLVEFWQERNNRLHDRILYRKQSDGSWKIERLAP